MGTGAPVAPPTGEPLPRRSQPGAADGLASSAPSGNGALREGKQPVLSNRPSTVGRGLASVIGAAPLSATAEPPQLPPRPSHGPSRLGTTSAAPASADHAAAVKGSSSVGTDPGSAQAGAPAAFTRVSTPTHMAAREAAAGSPASDFAPSGLRSRSVSGIGTAPVAPNGAADAAPAHPSGRGGPRLRSDGGAPGSRPGPAPAAAGSRPPLSPVLSALHSAAPSPALSQAANGHGPGRPLSSSVSAPAPAPSAAPLPIPRAASPSPAPPPPPSPPPPPLPPVAAVPVSERAAGVSPGSGRPPGPAGAMPAAEPAAAAVARAAPAGPARPAAAFFSSSPEAQVGSGVPLRHLFASSCASQA
jgi:hypothetical protein